LHGKHNKDDSLLQANGKIPNLTSRGPLDKLTTCFEELHLDVVALPTQAQPHNQWTSAPTWALIDKRAVLQQHGKLSQQAAHLIGRKITAKLKGDRTKRAVVAADIIKWRLTAVKPK
jgi:hypothetical protein